MRPARVLVWGATNNFGGVEAVLKGYISNIDPNCVHFDFIAPFDEISIETWAFERGSEIYHLEPRWRNFNLYRHQICAFASTFLGKYDAVWLNDCSFGNIDIIRLAKKFEVPIRIAHIHNSQNMDGGISRLIRHELNTLFLPHIATDFWACSNIAGKWAYSRRILKSSKYRLVPNAVSFNRFRFKRDVREAKRRFLHVEGRRVFVNVGRFHSQKNHPFLIRVFKELYEKDRSSVLLLVGTGEDEDDIRDLVQDTGLEGSVMFLGMRDDVDEILQASDAFLLPSHFEGLPVVIVEAQASGLPCYCSTAVTEEVCILPSTRRLSLDDSPAVWASIILDDMGRWERGSFEREFLASGYDIATSARLLEDFFVSHGGHK